MNNFTEIKHFDVCPGTDITQAVEEAITLAGDMKCVIVFDFNGIEMKIYDFSEVEMMVDHYHRKLTGKEIK